MNFKHLLSYLFFSISLILIFLFIHKIFTTEKKLDDKTLIVKIEQQRCKIKKMSDQVIDISHDLKNKEVDTFEIIKNKERIIVKVKENEIIIKDTFVQYITNVDTVTQYLTLSDTVYISNEIRETSVKEKKRRLFKKN